MWRSGVGVFNGWVKYTPGTSCVLGEFHPVVFVLALLIRSQGLVEHVLNGLPVGGHAHQFAVDVYAGGVLNRRWRWR